MATLQDILNTLPTNGNGGITAAILRQAFTDTWNKTTATVGQTITRPVSPYVGQMYFDTTLAVNGKPIWFNGVSWVDATGTIA